MNILSAFLIAYRSENGLTQAQLAEKLCMQQQNISRMEKGKINPSMASCEEIIAKLGYKLEIVEIGDEDDVWLY